MSMKEKMSVQDKLNLAKAENNWDKMMNNISKQSAKANSNWDQLMNNISKKSGKANSNWDQIMNNISKQSEKAGQNFNMFMQMSPEEREAYRLRTSAEDLEMIKTQGTRRAKMLKNLNTTEAETEFFRLHGDRLLTLNSNKNGDEIDELMKELNEIKNKSLNKQSAGRKSKKNGNKKNNSTRGR